MKMKLSILILVSTVGTIISYPYRFTRLIKANKAGEIEKTIDLISDAHGNLPNPSQQNDEITESDSIEARLKHHYAVSYNDTERTLIKTLLAMTQANKSIGVFWEATWLPLEEALEYNSKVLISSGPEFLQPRLNDNFYNIDQIRFSIFTGKNNPEDLQAINAKINTLLDKIKQPEIAATLKKLWEEAQKEISPSSTILSVMNIEAILNYAYITL